MKKIERAKYLINYPTHLCFYCKRSKGLSENKVYICKYNKNNNNASDRFLCKDNCKCKFFKRNEKIYTSSLNHKRYSIEQNYNKKFFNYHKGKYKIKGLDRFHIEFDGYYKGYRYVVIFQPLGFRCGYVEISANSSVMLNIKENEPDNYNSIGSVIDCHGGITYMDYNNNSYPVSNNNGFWVGFDACHYKDGTDVEQSYEYHLISFKNYIELKEFPIGKKENTKSFEYVVTECKNIINQILLFDDMLKEN